MKYYHLFIKLLLLCNHTGFSVRYLIVGIAVDFKIPLPCPIIYSDSRKW